jgi:hypothetical protein
VTRENISFSPGKILAVTPGASTFGAMLSGVRKPFMFDLQ